MANYTIPSIPLRVGASTLDGISIAIPSNVEETMAVDRRIFPHCSQIPADSSLSHATTYAPIMSGVGRKPPTKDEWESYRTEITRLYRDEKRTLIEVMKIMRERHDFRATTKMYKTRISDWDIRRNMRWSERQDACQHIEQRWRAGETVSKVVFRGQEKDLAVFLRHMRNAKHSSDNGKSKVFRAGTFQSHTGLTVPRAVRSSVPSEVPLSSFPKRVLYPAGDERRVEVICMQTAHICHSSSNDVIGHCDDLFGNMWHAMQRARENRYNEARVLLNRAGKWLQEHIRYEADAVLLYLLRSFSLQSRGRVQQFDPLGLFHRFALALSDIVHGPCHPLTIVLSQLLAVQDWVSATSSAVQAALDAIQLNGALNESDCVTHWLRHIFADMLEASGDCGGAGQVRLKVLEDYQNQKLRYPVYEINATFLLARHYLEFEPHKHEEAARLYESIRHFKFDSGSKTRDYATHSSFHGLARLAEKSGNLGKAEHYFRGCAEAAVRCWGEGDPESVEALENLARVLDIQGRHDEAERMWNQCQFSDNEGALRLAVSDDEVKYRQQDGVEDGKGKEEIHKL